MSDKYHSVTDVNGEYIFRGNEILLQHIETKVIDYYALVTLSKVAWDKLIAAKEQLGIVKRELEQSQKNMLILHIRSRIEELEKRFLKPYMLSWTRYDKWNKILRGATRDLKMKNELLRFRNSITMDIEELINTIVNLYGEFRDCAAHNIHYPIRYDDASIIELLKKFHITPDQSKVDAVKVILKPIP